MPELITGLLKDKSLSGAALLAIAVAEYGVECLSWEPEILRAELSDDFGVDLTNQQSDKLQAAITVVVTNQFEDNWHAFNTITHCLNNEPVEYDTFDPIDAEQIASVMAEIEILRANFMDGDLKFDDEVRAYAGLILQAYGLFFAPNVFSAAIMPAVQGDHYSDSQDEKKSALDEIYSAKKAQILNDLTKIKSCYPE